MSARLKEPEFHKWELDGATAIVCEPSRQVAEMYARRGVPLLFLGDLWVPPSLRGQGAAQGLMQAVTRWADRSGTDLWLYAKPFGPTPRLSQRALVEFYQQWGFERVARRSLLHQMVRRYAQH